MKKFAMPVLAALLIVVPAGAATLSIEWTAGDNGFAFDAQTADIRAGQTATATVFLRGMTEFDTVSGAGFSFEDALAARLLENVALPANWVSGGLFNQPISNAAQFLVGAQVPNTQSVNGPGEVALGYMTIQVEPGTAVGTLIDIAIDHDFIDIFNQAGVSYSYSATGSDSGVYHYGIGSPLVKKPSGVVLQERNPLMINVIPEPASLALLAIGGIALLRRR